MLSNLATGGMRPALAPHAYPKRKAHSKARSFQLAGFFGGNPNRSRTSSLDKPHSDSKRRCERSRIAWNFGLMLRNRLSTSGSSAGTIAAMVWPFSQDYGFVAAGKHMRGQCGQFG